MEKLNKKRKEKELAIGIGLKSLDRDLGDVHTWPHSHYLTRQRDGVAGKVRLKHRLCRCKINDMMKEETGTSIPFILHGTPFALLIPFLS